MYWLIDWTANVFSRSRVLLVIIVSSSPKFQYKKNAFFKLLIGILRSLITLLTECKYGKSVFLSFFCGLCCKKIPHAVLAGYVPAFNHLTSAGGGISEENLVFFASVCGQATTTVHTRLKWLHTANADVADVALRRLMKTSNMSSTTACVVSRECVKNTQDCAADRKRNQNYYFIIIIIYLP